MHCNIVRPNAKGDYIKNKIDFDSICCLFLDEAANCLNCPSGLSNENLICQCNILNRKK
jgi:hypothetical protein